MKKNPELIVRAVIVLRGKILLCKMKRRGHSFLPGGHVEMFEAMETSLKREIKEELDVGMKSAKFIGIAENMYYDGRIMKHELNVVFEVKLKSHNFHEREGHIEFHWIRLKDFGKEKILPKSLARSVRKWLNDGEIFFASETDDS